MKKIRAKIRTITLIMMLCLILGGGAYREDGWTERQRVAHEIAVLARSIGCDESSPIIAEASRIWWEDAGNEPPAGGEPEPAEALEEPAPWYTEDDIRILCNVVYYEAGGCPDRHQQLVAQVVLNRVNDPRFPDTVAGVVGAPRQYSSSYLTAAPVLSERIRANVLAALEGKVECPANVVYQAECVQGTGVYEISYVDTGWYRSTTYFCYG